MLRHSNDSTIYSLYGLWEMFEAFRGSGMFTFINELDNLIDIRAVGSRWAHEVKALGVTRASYHMTPAFASQTGPRTLVAQFGFPSEVMELYNDPDFRAHDPIPDLVMQLARPIVWKQVVEGRHFSRDQRNFLKTAELYGVTDAYAIPFYGPNGRDSYASYGFGREIRPEDARLLQTLIGIGQVAHLRISVLVKQLHLEKLKLSRRELDVLQLIALAKSNSDISTILGIAPATVDTYMRRVFEKLKASNRLTAVAAGLRRGLIHL